MNKKLLMAFFAVYCSTAAAGDFTYLLRSFPADNVQTCLETARTIAAKFEAASGVTPSSTTCESQEYSEATTIRITYSAAAEVVITTTESRQLDFTPRGFYTTIDECKADLQSQIDIFVAETGLTPIANFCFKTGYDHTREWAVRIDAVGNAARKPYYGSAIADSWPKSPEPPVLTEEFAAFFESKGAKLYKIAFKNVRERRIIFFYYGPERLKFDSKNFRPFPSIDECQKQQQYTDGVLSRSNVPASKYVASFCGGPYPDRNKMSLHVIWEGETTYSKYSIEHYETFALCEAARTDLLAAYHEQYGSRLLGGVCSYEPMQDFRVAFFMVAN